MQLVQVVDNKVNTTTIKIFIWAIAIGIIGLLALWLPLIWAEKEPVLRAVGVGIREQAKQPFDFKVTITWIIGTSQSFLLMLLTIKKLFGKK